MRDSGEFEAMPKKEALLIGPRAREARAQPRRHPATWSALPDAVFILDTKKEDIAVTEANKLGIPIVAVVDTNCDPDVIQYVIPGNDDAIRSGNLMCRVIADAVDEGRFIASRRGGSGAGPAPSPQPPRRRPRIAAQQAEARRQAAAAAAEREARVAGGQAPTPPAERVGRRRAPPVADAGGRRPRASRRERSPTSADGHVRGHADEIAAEQRTPTHRDDAEES